MEFRTTTLLMAMINLVRSSPGGCGYRGTLSLCSGAAASEKDDCVPFCTTFPAPPPRNEGGCCCRGPVKQVSTIVTARRGGEDKVRCIINIFKSVVWNITKSVKNAQALLRDTVEKDIKNKEGAISKEVTDEVRSIENAIPPLLQERSTAIQNDLKKIINNMESGFENAVSTATTNEKNALITTLTAMFTLTDAELAAYFRNPAGLTADISAAMNRAINETIIAAKRVKDNAMEAMQKTVSEEMTTLTGALQGLVRRRLRAIRGCIARLMGCLSQEIQTAITNSLSTVCAHFEGQWEHCLNLLGMQLHDLPQCGGQGGNGHGCPMVVVGSAPPLNG